MSEAIDLHKEKNFFETRVTEHHHFALEMNKFSSKFVITILKTSIQASLCFLQLLSWMGHLLYVTADGGGSRVPSVTVTLQVVVWSC